MGSASLAILSSNPSTIGLASIARTAGDIPSCRSNSKSFERHPEPGDPVGLDDWRSEPREDVARLGHDEPPFISYRARLQ